MLFSIVLKMIWLIARMSYLCLTRFMSCAFVVKNLARAPESNNRGIINYFHALLIPSLIYLIRNCSLYGICIWKVRIDYEVCWFMDQHLASLSKYSYFARYTCVKHYVSMIDCMMFMHILLINKEEVHVIMFLVALMQRCET